MGAPGFWDDQAAGRARHDRALARRPASSSATRRFAARSTRRPSSSSSTRSSRPRSPSRSRPVRDELARLQEEALFNGEYDAGDAVVTITAGTGRHGRAGLGGDAAAHVPPLDGRSRLPDRARRGEPGRGGGPQVGDVHRPRRERLRAVQGRARRPPARAPVAVRLRAPAPHGVRAGRRRAAPPRDRGRRDRRERPAHRHVPRERRGRPARQQDRLGRADHASPDRDRRPVPERALADVEQGDGDADPQVAARRARTRRSARPSSRRSGGARSTSASAARSARTCSTRTRWSRTTAPTTRSATRSRSSTARSTASCRPTCSPAPPATRSRVSDATWQRGSAAAKPTPLRDAAPPKAGIAAGSARRNPAREPNRTRLHSSEPEPERPRGTQPRRTLSPGAWTTCSHPCLTLPPRCSRARTSSRRTATRAASAAMIVFEDVRKVYEPDVVALDRAVVRDRQGRVRVRRRPVRARASRRSSGSCSRSSSRRRDGSSSAVAT